MGKKKIIMIDLDKWKIITDFLAGINIPLQQSINGALVVNAVNSAIEAEAEIKDQIE